MVRYGVLCEAELVTVAITVSYLKPEHMDHPMIQPKFSPLIHLEKSKLYCINIRTPTGKNYYYL